MWIHPSTNMLMTVYWAYQGQISHRFSTFLENGQYTSLEIASTTSFLQLQLQNSRLAMDDIITGVPEPGSGEVNGEPIGASCDRSREPPLIDDHDPVCIVGIVNHP